MFHLGHQVPHGQVLHGARQVSSFSFSSFRVSLKSSFFRLSEAEAILVGDSLDPRKELAIEDFVAEMGDSASFALQLLSTIFAKTERSARANESDAKALKLNPFLWTSFESLCGRGDFQDPSQVFNVSHLESLAHCHGVNSVINLVNGVNGVNNANVGHQVGSVNSGGLPSITVTSTPCHPSAVSANSGSHTASLTASTPLHAGLATPKPMETPENVMQTPIQGQGQMVMQHTPMDTAPVPEVVKTALLSSVMTPGNNSTLQSNNSQMMSGFGALNFTADSHHAPSAAVTPSNSSVALETPASSLMPPPLIRRRPRPQPHPFQSPMAYRVPEDSKVLVSGVEPFDSDNSLGTPTFGILRTKPKIEVGSTRLRLDFSSPSLSVLSPCLGAPMKPFIGMAGQMGQVTPTVDPTLPAPGEKISLHPKPKRVSSLPLYGYLA